MNGVVQLIPALTTLAVADAAALGTYKQRISGTANVSLQFIVAGADAAPIVSVYGSNSASGPWDLYKSASTNVVLPTSGSQTIFDDDFPPEYIAIEVDKNGGTTGTISCLIDLKEKTV